MKKLIIPVGMAINNEKKMYGCNTSATRMVTIIIAIMEKRNDQNIG